MNQLTIRGFGEELRSRILRLAKERGISLNKAALILLRRGAGLSEKSGQARVVGDSLDDLIGSWSKEEEEEFDKVQKEFDQIDESLG